MQHAAGCAPDGMDALATGELDDALAELAETNAAADEIGLLFDKAEDVALFGRGIEAEEQIRRGKMEKTERVGLQHLGVVEQAALEHGGGRWINAQQTVTGLGTGDDVADRANAAHARHQSRHFVEWAPFADFFEAAKLGDVELRGFYFARGIDVDRDFRVTFDARYGMNDDALRH